MACALSILMYSHDYEKEINATKARYSLMLEEKQRLIQRQDAQLCSLFDQNKAWAEKYGALVNTVEEQQKLIEAQESKLTLLAEHDRTRMDNYSELIKKVDEQKMIIDLKDEPYVRIVGDQLVKIIAGNQKIIEKQEKQLFIQSEQNKAHADNVSSIITRMNESALENKYYMQLQLCFVFVAISISYLVFGLSGSGNQGVFIASGVFILLLSGALILYLAYLNKNRAGKWI